MRPTKDVEKAILRLKLAAPFLICRGGHNYGGSIRDDIAAVLLKLEAMRERIEERAQP